MVMINKNDKKIQILSAGLGHSVPSSINALMLLGLTCGLTLSADRDPKYSSVTQGKKSNSKTDKNVDIKNSDSKNPNQKAHDGTKQSKKPCCLKHIHSEDCVIDTRTT